jgi:hypothetical protein
VILLGIPVGKLERSSIVYRMANPKFDSRLSQEIFSTPKLSYQRWIPPSLLTNWHGAHLPWVKRLNREADHWPKSCDSIKNE